ncbi:hypothetical protein NIE88_06340 [Sporolactobacillus shoreicorticis]|uniref:Uncharacterized protein n=1 Tax=Sporolactobacillus shoreicorticis TaxID=1923877 RepID=A0ABW5S189_9BACL|nr:hypothetical protein [Sporolactobacillus shoreicorticis]MCO7125385.1 hypothetical protein [Sporolactobacillus shoreicorticis]
MPNKESEFHQLFETLTDTRKIMLDFKEGVDKCLDSMDQRFDAVDKRLDNLSAQQSVMNHRIGNLETAQIETNVRLSKIEAAQDKTPKAFMAISELFNEHSR